ncbi:MAG TPA: DUF6776 family protein [Burkholderiales bacterium]|nr:DUF6776 family protein [Burkholderiales bacterium]
MPSLLKRIRSRFGIAAPRMTVRTHVAWYWRWLGIVVVAGLSLALAAWIYDAGRRFAGFDRGEALEQLDKLRADHAQLEKEAAELRAVANASEARLKIEQSAQAQLAAQIKQLGDENSRLKEDLAFFDGLNPADRREERITIHRFMVEKGDTPGQYRYRLLVVQGGRRDHDFQGSIQLMAELQGQGRNDMIPVTDQGSSSTAKRLNFRFFQRQEGSFQVPQGGVLKRVQVKVMEGGETRAVETAQVGQGAQAPAVPGDAGNANNRPRPGSRPNP